MNTANLSASDTLMFREAHETADVVARQFAANDAVVSALAATLRADPPRFIVTCARGSSDHAAAYAKYVFETQLGIVTASASPSVTSVYAAEQQWQGALFIAISQSGKSPDLLRNAEAAKLAGAHVLAMVNVEDSPLARLGRYGDSAACRSRTQRGRHQELPRRARGRSASVRPLETGRCARRGAGLVARCPSRQLGRGLVGAERGPGRRAQPVRGRTRFRFRHRAGSGAEVQGNLWPACRGVQRGRSEAWARWRWSGRISRCCVLRRTTTRWKARWRWPKEFRGRGAQVFVAAPGRDGPGMLPVSEALPAICTPLLVIQSFYRAASELALRRGFNPDVPPHLNKVTETV